MVVVVSRVAAKFRASCPLGPAKAGRGAARARRGGAEAARLARFSRARSRRCLLRRRDRLRADLAREEPRAQVRRRRGEPGRAEAAGASRPPAASPTFADAQHDQAEAQQHHVALRRRAHLLGRGVLDAPEPQNRRAAARGRANRAGAPAASSEPEPVSRSRGRPPAQRSRLSSRRLGVPRSSRSQQTRTFCGGIGVAAKRARTQLETIGIRSRSSSPVWNSNFGRPTPSMRRCPRHSLCSMAWRFLGIT